MERVYRFVAWTVLILVGLAALARVVAIRWWQVPPSDPELAASIAPTLRGGDWVLLWRLTRPGLGDLVMCPDPDEPNNVVIGRIAAMQGDTVTLHGQDVEVNGSSFNIEYNCTDQKFSLTDPDTLKEVEIYCDMEDIDGKLHQRGYGGQDERARRKYETELGRGEIFLLSDNRAHPFDSRHFGALDRRTCKETIFFRVIGENGFFDVDSRLTVIR